MASGPCPPGLGEAEPPQGCVLLAEDLASDALLREGLYAALLAHPRRAQEARKALAAGLEVAAPQVLRFRTAGGPGDAPAQAGHPQQATLRPHRGPVGSRRGRSVPRRVWEARFPFCGVRRGQGHGAVLERISGWKIHWGAWVVARPLGQEAPTSTFS